MTNNNFLFVFLVPIVIATPISTPSPQCQPAAECIASLETGSSCSLFPNPNRPTPINSRGFNLTQIRKGVFSYSDAVYFSLIVYENRKLAIIDFPDIFSSIAPDGSYRLLSALQLVLGDSIPKHIFMIYSHFHVDHIGRAADVKHFLSERYPAVPIRIVATRETFNFLQRNRDDIPLPSIFVTRRRPITIILSRTLSLKLFILGGHTKEDIVGYISPSSDGGGIVSLVDIINPKEAPLPQFTIAMNFESFITAQQELLELDFDIINPGHGVIGTRQDVVNNLNYSKFVLQAVRESAQELDPSVQASTLQRFFNPEAFEYFNNPWAFGQLISAQADSCFKKVISKWACVLTGVDVVARDHCFLVALYDFSSTFDFSQ
ncbi:Ribonuclease Z/Hydroxyacylglutathione hydrolase-like protein [Gracilaria domingensis]|nr:Ribonuclease Z/Hydroxyacylglutathione hydrolase-like protein [Gracilaria domingensis]